MNINNLFEKLSKGSKESSTIGSTVNDSLSFKSKNQIRKILNFLDSDKTYSEENEQFIKYFNDYVQPFIEKEIVQEQANNITSVKKESKYLRISYSEISKYIFELKDKQFRIDAIQYNLNLIISNNTLDYAVRKIAAKIFDHIELCGSQSDSYQYYISKLEKTSQSIKNEYDKKTIEIETEMKKTSKIIGKLENKLFTQVITIVSILSGLAFVLFGGITLIDKLSEFSISSISGYWFSISYLCLIGFILVSLIFTLLNFITKLLDKFNNDNKNFIKTNKIFIFILVTLIILYVVSLFLALKNNNFYHSQILQQYQNVIFRNN